MWDSVIWTDFQPIHNLYIGISADVSMADSVAADISKTECKLVLTSFIECVFLNYVVWRADGHHLTIGQQRHRDRVSMSKQPLYGIITMYVPTSHRCHYDICVLSGKFRHLFL